MSAFQYTERLAVDSGARHRRRRQCRDLYVDREQSSVLLKGLHILNLSVVVCVRACVRARVLVCRHGPLSTSSICDAVVRGDAPHRHRRLWILSLPIIYRIFTTRTRTITQTVKIFINI